MATKVPILLYHSISDEASPAFRPWALSPERFAQHLAYLKAEQYTPLTVGQFVEMKCHARTLPAKPVVVAFDDGLADFYDNALPLLEDFDVPATLYVVAGRVGKTSKWLASEGEGARPMMTWAQVRQLRNSLVELGSHSMSHAQLDTLPLAQARTEVLLSKALLEDQLQQPVTTFAYPHGYYSKAVRAMVQEAGYTSACAVKHGMSSTEDDTFALARMFVYRDTTVAGLAKLLAGEGVRRVSKHETLKTKAWRWVRRVQRWQRLWHERRMDLQSADLARHLS